jgi:hypothetical protein
MFPPIGRNLRGTADLSSRNLGTFRKPPTLIDVTDRRSSNLATHRLGQRLSCCRQSRPPKARRLAVVSWQADYWSQPVLKLESGPVAVTFRMPLHIKA